MGRELGQLAGPALAAGSGWNHGRMPQRSPDTYRAVAWELDELCERLVDGLFGKAPSPTSLTSMWKDGE